MKATLTSHWIRYKKDARAYVKAIKKYLSNCQDTLSYTILLLHFTYISIAKPMSTLQTFANETLQVEPPPSHTKSKS